MGESWFLKLDGITGESTNARHPGEIDVRSWSWGVSTTVAATGSGGGAGGAAGKASFEAFRFEAAVSRASPPLFHACATGRHLRSARLTGRRGGGPGFDFLTFTLSDVTIASVQHGDTPMGGPTEEFTLRFAKVEMTYRQQSPTGAAAPPVTAVFDLVRGR